MFLNDELAVYGFEFGGKTLTDEFRALLFKTKLALFGLERFELVFLDEGCQVCISRSAEKRCEGYPWCHLWGTCPLLQPKQRVQGDELFEEIEFQSAPIQLIKHFHQDSARVLVCLPPALKESLHYGLLKKELPERTTHFENFLQKLNETLGRSTEEQYLQ